MVNTSDQNSDFYQLDKDLYYYQETYDSIVEDFGFDSIMNSTLSGEETRCEVSLEIRSNVFFPRSESNIEDQESIIIKYTLPYLDKDIIRILSCLFYHTDSIDTIVDKLEKKLSFKPTEVVSSVVSQYLEDLFRIEDRDIYEYTIFLTISRFTNNNNDPDAGSIYKNTISGSDDENVEAFIDNASLLLTLLRGYPDEKRIPDTFKICGPILNLVDIYSDDAGESYQKIRTELEKYSAELVKRPEVVALTKVDGVDQDIVDMQIRSIKKFNPDVDVLAISSVAHQGLTPLLRKLKEVIKEANDSNNLGAKNENDIPVISLPDTKVRQKHARYEMRDNTPVELEISGNDEAEDDNV